MKKILALALTLIMVFALFGGTNAFAAKDGSVYWLNFKPELDETAQQLAWISLPCRLFTTCFTNSMVRATIKT